MTIFPKSIFDGIESKRKKRAKEKLLARLVLAALCPSLGAKDQEGKLCLLVRSIGRLIYGD